MNQRCYTGQHLSLFVPLGAVATPLLVLAPPLVAILVLVKHRKTLHEPHTCQMYGYLYHKYRWARYMCTLVSCATRSQVRTHLRYISPDQERSSYAYADHVERLPFLHMAMLMLC